MLNVLLALTLAANSASSAELTSQADKPYRLLVVLHFADGATFTPAYTAAVEREVRDQLRALFGPLAAVEVANEHPLVDRLAPGGLAAFELPREKFAESLAQNGQPFDKVFLFDLDYRSGRYELAWRQLDGDVEQLGPYRTRQTPDRLWVAKAIGLAVKEDFAPTAIVRPTAERNKVQLEFRGSLIQSPGSQLEGRRRLAAWLGEDCILQSYWVVRQADGSLARVALPHTVLALTSDGGGKWARVITNLPNPWHETARVVGFQACKLHTQSGRFRLHLVDQATGAPLQNCAVYAGQNGFDSLGDGQRLADPDARGCVVAPRPFENLAYVRISQGAGPGVQLPLPITADWCELTCKVSVDERAAEKSDLELQTGYLVEDFKSLETGLGDRIRQVNQLNAEKRYEEALRATNDALTYVKKFGEPARKSLKSLDARRASLKLQPGASLAWVEKQSQELARQQAGLETLAANLQRIIERNDAQSRANVLIELGAQAERDGQIDEAIEKYVLALGEQPEQPQLKSRLALLKTAWEIKSPAQRQARAFVYAVWDKTEPAGVESALPKARESFEALRAAGDFLASGKLMKVNERLVADLDQLAEQLASRDGEADRQEHEKYVGLLEQLAKFQQQVADYYATASAESNLPPAPAAAEGKSPGMHGEAPKAPKKAPPKPATAASDAVPASQPDASSPSTSPSRKDKADEDEEEPPLSKNPPEKAKP